MRSLACVSHSEFRLGDIEALDPTRETFEAVVYVLSYFFCRTCLPESTISGDLFDAAARWPPPLGDRVFGNQAVPLFGWLCETSARTLTRATTHGTASTNPPPWPRYCSKAAWRRLRSCRIGRAVSRPAGGVLDHRAGLRLSKRELSNSIDSRETE
jgi:hypothetical protein